MFFASTKPSPTTNVYPPKVCTPIRDGKKEPMREKKKNTDSADRCNYLSHPFRPKPSRSGSDAPTLGVFNIFMCQGNMPGQLLFCTLKISHGEKAMEAQRIHSQADRPIMATRSVAASTDAYGGPCARATFASPPSFRDGVRRRISPGHSWSWCSSSCFDRRRLMTH